MPEDVSAVAVYQQLLESQASAGGNVVRAARSTAALTRPERAATGISRLDDLLGGGLPAGTATLLHGPPFTGKGVLERQFFLRGVQSGEPSVYLLTDASSTDLLDRLAIMDANVGRQVGLGNAHFIDAYSRLIGEEGTHAGTLFIDDLRSLNQVARGVEKIDQQLRAQGRGVSRLVIQSLSTIMMEAGSAECFRFLRTMVGRVARRGGTVLAGLEAGMHTDADVQAVKHLCNGMIQTKEADDKHYMRVEGLPTRFTPGWVEYEFSPIRLELTGSFSSERIRGTALAAQ